MQAESVRVSPRRNLVGPEFDAWYENRLIRYPLRMVSCDHFTSSVLVSTSKRSHLVENSKFKRAAVTIQQLS